MWVSWSPFGSNWNNMQSAIHCNYLFSPYAFNFTLLHRKNASLFLLLLLLLMCLRCVARTYVSLLRWSGCTSACLLQINKHNWFSRVQRAKQMCTTSTWRWSKIVLLNKTAAATRVSALFSANWQITRDSCTFNFESFAIMNQKIA